MLLGPPWKTYSKKLGWILRTGVRPFGTSLRERLVPFLGETTLTLEFVCFSLLRYVSQWHFRACASGRRSRPEKRGPPRQADARRAMKLGLSQCHARACAHSRRSRKKEDPPDSPMRIAPRRQTLLLRHCQKRIRRNSVGSCARGFGVLALASASAWSHTQ